MIFVIPVGCFVVGGVLIAVSAHKLRKSRKQYLDKMQELRDSVQEFKHEVHDAMTDLSDDIEEIINEIKFEK